MPKIKNREQIIEQLTEVLMQFDKEMNHYQTDVYLYYDKINQTAELNTFVNVGGNSWLDDDHCTIYTDKEHYETVWDWFNDSTEIADILEYSTYTEFDYDVRQALEIEENAEISWEDYIAYVKLNDDYMEKIYTAYKEVIDDMRSEYTEKAEVIMEQFKNESEGKFMRDYTNEELISRLCYLWTKETKTARTEEKRIAKELEKRGIVNAERLINEMNY